MKVFAEAGYRRIIASRRFCLLVGIIAAAMAYGFYWTEWGTLKTAADFWRLAGSGLGLLVGGFALAVVVGRCPACGQSMSLVAWPLKCAGCGREFGGQPAAYSPEEEAAIRREVAERFPKAVLAYRSALVLSLVGVVAVGIVCSVRGRTPDLLVSLAGGLVFAGLIIRCLLVWSCPGCGGLLQREGSVLLADRVNWGIGRPQWGPCPDCRFDPGPLPGAQDD